MSRLRRIVFAMLVVPVFAGDSFRNAQRTPSRLREIVAFWTTSSIFVACFRRCNEGASGW